MESFDAVIIGSGAGGAPIASELAREGKTVLVLDKGPLLRTQDEYPSGTSDFKRDELFGYGTERMLKFNDQLRGSFFPSHVEPDLNDEPHVYTDHSEQNPIATIEGYTAQVVGGGTQLYGAVSLRFSENDFRLKSFNSTRNTSGFNGDPFNDPDVDIVDWPIQYSDLVKYYDKAEQLLGINGTKANQKKPFPNDNYQKPLPPNPISEFARKGMRQLNMPAYRTPLAVITQDHDPSGRKKGDPKTGYVNRYGDPLGLKSNTWVALLRPALKDVPDKLEIRPNCVVTHLASNGPKVTAVHYRDPSGVEKAVTGKIVVVACSAIESVRLLMLSAEQDTANFGQRVRYQTSGSLLGRYFLTHCFGGAEIRIHPDLEKNPNHPIERFDKSVSLDSDFATDSAATQTFLNKNQMWAGGAIYNNTSDQALPISLARTHGSVDLDKLWTSFMSDNNLKSDELNNFFLRDFGTRLSVSFMANQIPWFKNHIKLHSTTDKWGRKNAHIVKHWHPHDVHVMKSLAQVCKDILTLGVPTDLQQNLDGDGVQGQGERIANHILGGARFGTDRDNSVLDVNCKVWDFDNLYVTDGSFMPTSGGANPTLTIQANAFRVADVLKTQI